MSEGAEKSRERITQPDQVLYRPIAQAFVADGVVAPDAFLLNSADVKDHNRLSITRGSVATAEDAYNERAATLKAGCEKRSSTYRPPVGVLGVTVEEVEAVEIKSPEGSEARRPLTAWDDSMNEGVPDAHGHIDYSDVPFSEKGAHLNTAKALLARAVDHGWKYGPIDE
ncbi:MULTISPECIES: endo-1,4-beta-xylanase [Rhodococcus]|uniref:endo-1,4-beta-xylanase n=1 Tax=Rhodococcus TaxID=1827 RepID=UPI0022CD2406|nr:MULTISPECIES: endo-1,4-beta-xylanase [Rhodococcus]MCZ9629559.1 endo-1,4-beta-xylanase [Rhodococcus sp. BH5]MEA1796606.1 endo-1,4-beta-xylanase [Rhodococcus qingshengii]